MGNLRGRYAKVNAEIIDNTLKRARHRKKGVRPMTKAQFRYCAMRDLKLLEEYYDDFEQGYKT